MRSNKIFLIMCAALLMLCWIGADLVQAQLYEIRWMNIGSLHSYYEEAGIEPRRDPRDGLVWPAYDTEAIYFTRRAMWIAVQDWTDPEGTTWKHRISHVGPRISGIDEVFPIEYKLIAKYAEPDVVVDGLLTFLRPVFAQTIDEIDPTIKPDRIIYAKLNTLHGITYERRVLAFSQEYHDNYHIWEYTYTNTGNVDGDDEVELPNQTLEGVYIGFRQKYTTNRSTRFFGQGTGSGRNTITDVIGDGMKDYINDPEYGVDLRATYSWHGRSVKFNQYNTLGGPIWRDSEGYSVPGDSVGRLGAPGFIGRLTLLADRSPSDHTDDPGQPSTTTFLTGGQIQEGDAWNVPMMAEEYALMTTGHTYPFLFDQIIPPSPEYTSWRQRAASQTVEANLGQSSGQVPLTAYGPYTLGPGQSVRITVAEGINGLDRIACVEIGKAYKQSGGDDALIIEYNGQSMTKNEWVMTGRDSLFKMFARISANYQSGYNIPEPPRPPESFTVTSGGDRIKLNWTPFEGHEPSYGWEIYCGRYQFAGAVEDNWQYTLVAELPPSARSFDDTEVIRGISYFYYIQAVGDVNNDPTGLTPTGVRLKSNRYYTQTYAPAFLKRKAGEKLKDIRIVPNPYVLVSAKDVRWPDVENQIAFLDIPGQCTIKIFTERGDLVKEIEHTDFTGDEFWNLQTMTNQMIVSGIYIAAITDNESGETILKKFIIIR